MSRSSARSHVGVRSLAVSLLALLCLGLIAPSAGAATGDITEFTVPPAGSLLQGIAVGSDGTLWFAERNANAVGSLSNGTFSQYQLPNAASAPFSGDRRLRRERVVHGALRESDRHDHTGGHHHRILDPHAGQSTRRDHRRARRCPLVHGTDRATGSAGSRPLGRSRSSHCPERPRDRSGSQLVRTERCGSPEVGTSGNRYRPDHDVRTGHGVPVGVRTGNRRTSPSAAMATSGSRSAQETRSAASRQRGR